ncbi:hypothetical protein EIP91_009754 [Steccherinum ochraceum]|uniref:BHLH domain-containing protein n=1 Tax=Steccherinum ochraceum TaxID=92696 RepID=A0A4V2MV09_9APHY|nr:hypothetical protein EIP91_009754 [Steccherinum ochraceum]
MLANEKRRRRRESHNAVERRRRDNINEKISELATLIPECLLDPATGAPSTSSTSNANEDGALMSPTSPSGGGMFDEEDVKELSSGKEGNGKGGKGKGDMGEKGEKDDGKEGAGVKANKGMILRKSVEYIRYLQQLVTAQASRNRDLEQQLQTYRSGGIPTPPAQHSSVTPTSSTSSSELISEGANGLVLHDEVDLSSLPPIGSGSGTGTLGRKRSQSTTKRFGSGFELESVEEMDMEEDPGTAVPTKHFTRSAVGAGNGEDEDMERPGTMMSMSVSLSPSGSGSGGEDDDEDGLEDERERGRKREGRGREEVKVKVKEEVGMEMS